MKGRLTQALRAIVWSGIALAAALHVGRADAQEWARKMFKSTQHDFGSVARGSKAEFAFEFENVYEEEAHVAGVRSSCGCTTPIVTKDTLKTWEKGTILTSLNTTSFSGQKNATVTVLFDRPFAAEVRLDVSALIRTDLVFTPGNVQFGDVDAGAPVERSVNITHAGRSDWQILDVRSAHPYYEVMLNESRRTLTTVDYRMVVRLKPDAPAGYLQDQLTLVTNDPQPQMIPIMVEGRVVSPLSVSPASLLLGVVRPGEKVTKQIIVKGKRPFRISRVECASESFEFRVNDAEAKTVHIVPVTFTAVEGQAKVSEQIEVQTELGPATLTAVATVAPR